ncbi:type IA DNA topoisomerase [Bacillus toyonensis]|uniref:type IA DNA topoisomerase n=1 Tax=Bacillus toyonensis TaxID=155322 RepID=UPI001C0E5B4E|nr:type IA DNA topoisomerase [Bacillus toyonensis]MBU4642905.1 topoisomerase C-terminal repeat-containing protein [Bacillus toyonensis]
MKIILCEKPQQMKSYSEAFQSAKRESTHIAVKDKEIFGDEEVIMISALGHLVELCNPDEYKEEWKNWSMDQLPIIPEEFKMKVSKDKEAMFKNAKHWLQKADEIIIATDPARAGEAIAKNIIIMAGVNHKPQKRFWVKSMTHDAVRKGFQNLRDAQETHSYYLEEQARSVSDWIVGMNASRVFSLLFRDQKGVKEVFSAGRVQSALLHLIRQREKELESFKVQAFYEIHGHFQANGTPYVGKLLQDNNIMKLLSKEEAQGKLSQLLQHTARIQKVTVEQKSKQAPKLHNLSSLQAKLNKKYKMSPKVVLETAQSLYDKRMLSYPRTEYQHIPVAEAEQLPRILEKLTNITDYQTLIEKKERDTIVDQKTYVNDEKCGDHYALIPTSQVPSLETLSKEERWLYDEVVRSVIATFYQPMTYNQTDLFTEVNTAIFKSTGKQITHLGWQVVFGKEEKEEKPEQKEQTLPIVEQGQSVDIKEIKLYEGKTQPPKLYTEGQLITLMAKHDIGSEATRSGIIERIKTLLYIQIEKNTVYVTNKGKMMVEAIKDTAIGSPELTAKWEVYLKGIGEGKKNDKPFVETSKKLAHKLINEAKDQVNTWAIDEFIEGKKSEHHIGECPSCGKPVVDKKTIYGCTGYVKEDKNSCKFSVSKEFLGQKISESNIVKLLEGKKTTLIKGLKGKSGKVFDAYLKLEDAKIQFVFPKKKQTVKSN